MIERVISSKDKNSKYYHDNLALAEAWELYAKKTKADLSGMVNGAILEFEMEFESRKKAIHIEIKGIKQLANTSSGSVLVTDFAMIESTTIKLSPFDLGVNDWKIYKKGRFLDLFNKIKGNCVPFSYDAAYSIASKNELPKSDFLSAKLFRFLSNLGEIRRISYTRSILKIEYFNLLSAEAAEQLVGELLS